jgi:hypothetical protein
MKTIFHKSIGTLRDLGTKRQWVSGAVWMAVCAAVVVAALIIL